MMMMGQDKSIELQISSPELSDSRRQAVNPWANSDRWVETGRKKCGPFRRPVNCKKSGWVILFWKNGNLDKDSTSSFPCTFQC